MASFYQLSLKANTASTLNVQGKLILVDKVEGADGVDITPVLNSSTGRTMPGRRQAFKAWIDYDTIILQASADCVVSLWLSNTDVSLGFTDGAMVNVAGGVSIVNDMDNRIPVDLAGGNVQVTASNVGINNSNDRPVPVQKQRLSALAVKQPAVIGAAQAVVVSNDAGYMRICFRNASVTQSIALGGEGVAFNSAAIVLGPGEMWIEDDAAGATWYAVADAEGANLRVMGMK